MPLANPGKTWVTALSADSLPRSGLVQGSFNELRRTRPDQCLQPFVVDLIEKLQNLRRHHMYAHKSPALVIGQHVLQ